MDKFELLNSLGGAFSDLDYPLHRDFYKAIADRDYEDYTETDERKKWEEVSKAELKKYYDFIYFLDQDALIYYLPSYMKLILENSDSEEDEHFLDLCSTCLFSEFSRINVNMLNAAQLQITIKFLHYYQHSVIPKFGFDQSFLAEAIRNLKK